jgi:hypothetical protein
MEQRIANLVKYHTICPKCRSFQHLINGIRYSFINEACFTFENYKWMIRTFDVFDWKHSVKFLYILGHYFYVRIRPQLRTQFLSDVVRYIINRIRNYEWTDDCVLVTLV